MHGSLVPLGWALIFVAACSSEPLTLGTPDFGARDARRRDLAGCTVDCEELDLAGVDLEGVDLALEDLTPGDVDLRRDDAAVLTPVAHVREIRAAWVGTVFRLDFPSRTDLTPTQARDEIATIVDVIAAAGFNALFVQIRPESDAFYSSSLEPWSRFASGTQGIDPGYDPLALFLEIGHARGIEVHAWMNPYRALATPGVTTSPLHVTQRFPGAAITYNGAVVMNPADTSVRAHVISVVADVTQRYDIDGVVFDDYFYPYPGATAFPDDASYTAYVNGGGTMSKSDWRRDNVNALVSGVSSAIRAEKPWVRFGIAPFGIYRPGMPSGVTGLDAYEVLACDSLHWMNQDWVDYLAPQLYWTSTSTGQPFGALIDWWASKSKPGRPIFASLALYKLGTTSEWTLAEIEKQVTLTRGESGAGGATWFRYGYMRDDVLGVSASFDTLYGAPARPPLVPALASATLAAPTVSIGIGSVQLSHLEPATLRGYAVYRAVGANWSFAQWVPVGTDSVALSAGRYGISAMGRGGVESLGVSVLMP